MNTVTTAAVLDQDYAACDAGCTCRDCWNDEMGTHRDRHATAGVEGTIREKLAELANGGRPVPNTYHVQQARTVAGLWFRYPRTVDAWAREEYAAIMRDGLKSYDDARDDHEDAQEATHDGLASVLPAIQGNGLMEGLSDPERRVVLTAMNNARIATRKVSDDEDKIERRGNDAARKALAAVLAIRPRAVAHATLPAVQIGLAPVCGGSPEATLPAEVSPVGYTARRTIRTLPPMFTPTAADEAWLVEDNARRIAERDFPYDARFRGYQITPSERAAINDANLDRTPEGDWVQAGCPDRDDYRDRR